MFSYSNSWKNVRFYDNYDVNSTRYLQVKKAIEYSVKSPTAYFHLNKVFVHKVKLRVELYEYGTDINYFTQTLNLELIIRWCPNRAVITWLKSKPYEHYYSTPAFGLLHEFIHLSNFLSDRICYSGTFKNKRKDEYTDEQEYETITIIHGLVVPEFKRIGIKNPPDQIAHEGASYYVPLVTDKAKIE